MCGAGDETMSNNPKAALKDSPVQTYQSHEVVEPMNIEMSVEESIEKLGYGKFQVLVMFATGLCLAADAMEVLLLSFLSVVLKAQWNLTNQQTALMTGIVFLGAFLGTFVLGRLGDKIGRRPVYIMAAAIIAIFGFATAFSNSFTMLVIIRGIVGFGVGGMTVPFDILAEFLPTSTRGKNLLYIEFFWTGGTLLVPLFAILTLSNDFGQPGDNSWRTFVILCAVPCAISAVLGPMLVPESPRWLCTFGKRDVAMNILRRAAKMNGKDPDDIFPSNAVLKEEKPEDATICDLFSSRWRWTTLKLWTVWFTYSILYYGIILLSTRIFSQTPEKNGNDEEETYSFDYGAIFTSCSAEVVGVVVVVLTVDSLGRVISQAYSYCLGGIAILLVGFLQGNEHRGVIIALAFIGRMLMMSGSSVTWVGTAEILTTEIRTTGHAVANAMARFGAFFSPFIVQEIESLRLIGGLMFAISIIATAASMGLPETRGRQMGTVGVVVDQKQENDNKTMVENAEFA